MKNRNAIFFALSLVVLIALSGAAGAYFMKSSMEPKPAPHVVVNKNAKQNIAWDQKQPQAAPVQQQAVNTGCNDHNIVGTVAGGAAGGLVGSRFGKGNGRTATTTLGAVGGAVLGNKYIPTQNVACR